MLVLMPCFFPHILLSWPQRSKRVHRSASPLRFSLHPVSNLHTIPRRLLLPVCCVLSVSRDKGARANNHRELETWQLGSYEVSSDTLPDWTPYSHSLALQSPVGLWWKPEERSVLTMAASILLPSLLPGTCSLLSFSWVLSHWSPYQAYIPSHLASSRPLCLLLSLPEMLSAKICSWLLSHVTCQCPETVDLI